MRPGLTGLWQVRARHDPSFERWVELDLEYIDNWSIATDLNLLAKTPLALIRHPGR
jgi:lipopolysaccharide/colanic/teichoic acid biosynthesis glycosyltransferase